MRPKWVAVGLICLLSARPSAAGQAWQVSADVVEKARRPSILKGIGSALDTSSEELRPVSSRGAAAGIGQPTTVVPQSRSWFLRHSVLVGVVSGVVVGAVAATAGDNKLFCRGNDESCVLHSPGLKLVGVGVFGAIGGLAGYLVGLGW